MEQAGQSQPRNGQFIFLSRNSKLARIFQETPTGRMAVPVATSPPPLTAPGRTQVARPAATACPKLQAVDNPSLELTRPLAAALMREQAPMRCRARGALLDNEYVRDICAAGAHQHCPFLRD